MKTYFLSVIFIVVANCNSSSQNMSTNTKTEIFPELEKFPNNQVAYQKKEANIFFYNNGKQISVFNTISNIFNTTASPENTVNVENLIKLSRFLYFIPDQYYINIEYPTSSSSTGVGNFHRYYQLNKIGLLEEYNAEFPKGNSKIINSYNKYGQLLKIVEDKIINKILMENTYDEKARLVEQQKNYSELNSKRTYIYNDKNQIVKENVWQKEIAPNGNIIRDERYILNYEYNFKNQLIRKLSEDGKKSFQYTYNEKGLLVKELIYETVYKIQENSNTTVINDFQENLHEYDNDNKLVKEIKKEAHFNISTKFVNKRWLDLNEEEQTEYAWEKYKKNENFFTLITYLVYQYSGKNLTNSTKKVINYFNNGNQYVSEEQTQLQEKIDYTYNNLGQIIKKEVFTNNSAVSETYSYK